MKQRDTSEVLVNTADLVRKAREKADASWWTGHPAAHRHEEEARLLEARYGAGETVTPTH